MSIDHPDCFVQKIYPNIIFTYFDWQIDMALLCGYTENEREISCDDIVMSIVMGADMTFADLLEWYKFRISAYCFSLMKSITLFEACMRNMDQYSYSCVFIEFFLKIKKSFIFDAIGNCTPRFKFVMDMSNAQMNGTKIALAYMIAWHDKDELFLDLLAKRDDIKVYKYVPSKLI